MKRTEDGRPPMPPTEVLRIGLCGIGLQAYWSQFDGLEARLRGYLRKAGESMQRPGVHVVELGMVDTPQRSLEAGHACRREDIDLLVIYLTTYALSSVVLPMVRRAGVPVLLLNLQPEAAIDYGAFNRLPNRTAMTGEWLAWCSACPAPEIANVLRRAKISFDVVTGTLAERQTWDEVDEWVAAAQVKAALERNRLGLMGHYYNGMLDVMTDATRIAAVFGTHLEMVEVDELSGLRAEVDEASIAARVKEFHQHFAVQPDCDAEELRRAARTSVALDRFAEAHALGSLAYYAEGTGNAANEDTMSSIILGTSLLTARNIPVAGEYEVKNAIAMKILDSLGAGGSFTEYYAADYDADIVLMGHDGPGHLAIAQGKPKVRPLDVYHGKVGRGVSVEMSVQHGPVTLLSVVEDEETGFKLLVAEGESEPGAILKIGNTNSRYRFAAGARGFQERWNAQGPAHHCAVGVGHLAGKLKKLARLLRINFCQV